MLLDRKRGFAARLDGSAMSALALKSKAPCTAVKTAG
jgi:hypothetical protein